MGLSELKMFRAIENENWEEMQREVEEGANIHSLNQIGMSPLHLVAKKNCIELIDFFLQRNVDVEIKSKFGCTPLQSAASTDALEAINFLISRGAKIDATTDDGRIAMHFAACGNALRTMNFLIGKGIDLRKKDSCGNTLAHYAAIGGAFDVLRLLIDKGIRIDEKNSLGQTPLDVAKMYIPSTKIHIIEKYLSDTLKLREATQKLLKCINSGDVAGVKDALAMGANTNTFTDEGLTPLIIAVRRNDPQIVKILLNHAAEAGNSVNLELSDYTRKTALDWINSSTHPEIKDHILRKKLFKDVSSNNCDGVARAIQAGADVNARNELGQTPFILAVKNKSYAMVKALLEMKDILDLSIRDNAGKTAKDWAEELGCENIKELILLSRIKERLGTTIFGQGNAIQKVVDIILSHKDTLRPNKPLASLFFAGPSGVGKTQLVKEIAKALNLHLETIDMSEYKEHHTVSTLLGSPAGYVGSSEGGWLVKAINKNPECILLLDEFEKAHPDLHLTFLQVMQEGRLTDRSRNMANFEKVIFVVTSNANKKEREVVFRPETLGRFDAVIDFNAINMEAAKKIVNQRMEQMLRPLKIQGMRVTISDDCVPWIAQAGFEESKIFGARALQRATDAALKSLANCNGSMFIRRTCTNLVVRDNFLLIEIQNGMDVKNVTVTSDLKETYKISKMITTPAREMYL